MRLAQNCSISGAATSPTPAITQAVKEITGISGYRTPMPTTAHAATSGKIHNPRNRTTTPPRDVAATIMIADQIG